MTRKTEKIACRGSRSWPALGLLLSLAACSAPAPDGDHDPEDTLLWGGGKGDELDEAEIEPLLPDAFDERDPLRCAVSARNAAVPQPLENGEWQSLTTNDGNFVIFYRTEGPDRVLAAWLDLAPRDGHPDFINQVAEGIEQAHRWFTDAGYPMPRTPVQIFVKDADNYFGYANTDRMVVDNDSFAYKISRHFLRATAAHEYSHLVQFRLADLEGKGSNWLDRWFMEASAVWFEQQATGLFDGFVGAFIRDLLLHSRYAVGKNDALFEKSYDYASFGFVQYLAERYGSPDLIKQILTLNSQGLLIIQAIDRLAQQGVLPASTSFDKELCEYAAWTYLAGSRDDGEHFSDGKKWFHGLKGIPAAATHKSLPAGWQTPESFPAPLAAQHIELQLPKDAGALTLEVGASTAAPFRLTTLARGRQTGAWTTTHHEPTPGAALQSVRLESAGQVDRLVLTVVHLPWQGTIWAGGPVKPLEYRYRVIAP